MGQRRELRRRGGGGRKGITTEEEGLWKEGGTAREYSIPTVNEEDSERDRATAVALGVLLVHIIPLALILRMVVRVKHRPCGLVREEAIILVNIITRTRRGPEERERERG